jgi:hypothetical protein
MIERQENWWADGQNTGMLCRCRIFWFLGHFKWNGLETPHGRKAFDAPRFAWHILACCKRKQQDRVAYYRKNVKITAWEFSLPLREGVGGSIKSTQKDEEPYFRSPSFCRREQGVGNDEDRDVVLVAFYKNDKVFTPGGAEPPEPGNVIK